MQPTTQPQTVYPHPQTIRRYDLDWLRVIAIITLLFYHTGMIYVSWGWHIKSLVHSQPMEEVMRWLHRWRMPLLFFISGAGAFFALKKRSYGRYAGERVTRLLVPLIFGMFVIVPPQIYYEWLSIGQFTGSFADFYPNVFGFQPYQDGGKGGAFSWHHLWFICYLFVYSLISIPFFRFLRTQPGQTVINGIAWLVSRPGGLMILVVPIIISQAVLGLYFPDETHALVNDWPYFTNNLLLFWYGYLLVCSPNFTPQLATQRRVYLAITLSCTVILYGMRLVFTPEQVDDVSPVDVIYDINGYCLTIASILMTIGYGYRYLNKNHRILPYLNQAVYPFYILHQTVIVVIGYYLLKTGLGVYSGFLAISLLSGLTCVLIIWFLIRPFQPMRFLFGMK